MVYREMLLGRQCCCRVYHVFLYIDFRFYHLTVQLAVLKYLANTVTFVTHRVVLFTDRILYKLFNIFTQVCHFQCESDISCKVGHETVE